MRHAFTTAAGILVILCGVVGCGYLFLELGDKLTAEKLGFLVTMLGMSVGTGMGLIGAADGKNVQLPQPAGAVQSLVSAVAAALPSAPAAPAQQPPPPSASPPSSGTPPPPPAVPGA